MSELKFRARIISLKQHLYITGFRYENKYLIRLWFYKDDAVITCEFSTDDVILEQYTDRKDRNGKEIYEGDIFEYYDGYQDLRGIIAFEEGAFCQKDGICLFNFNKMCKIIGNIHENPELSEGDKL